MRYSLLETSIKHGKYPGPRFAVLENGTSNMAIYKNKIVAEDALRRLYRQQSRFCECGSFILGSSYDAAHWCAATPINKGVEEQE